jgi:DNA-damage-inducible protein D
MDDIISTVQLNFESIKMTAEDGMEYWLARSLMPLMGYNTWQRFHEVIEKAKEACKFSGQEIDVHFLAAPLKSTGGRPQENYFLTRYACYLILQNGDPRKTEVALSQTYFATKTRKQELIEQRAIEDRRIEARTKLKETEDKIESTVYKRGITLPVEFATFKNKHIEALYGGTTAAELKKKRDTGS